MVYILKAFLKLLCKLRFTRGFVNRFFRRWALFLAFLVRKFSIWQRRNDGKGGVVTIWKSERTGRSFRGTKTQFDLREWAAASNVPASASKYHVPNAPRQLQPATSGTTYPPAVHFTAVPQRDCAYPASELATVGQPSQVLPDHGYLGSGLFASPSSQRLSRSPSPGDHSPRRSSSRGHVLLSPPSNPGHRRRQSSTDVVVDIQGPSTSTGPLGLSPSTSQQPSTEEPFGSSTSHLLPISNSDIPSGFSVKPMNPDQVPRYTRNVTVTRNDAVCYKIPPFTKMFRPERRTPEEDCAPWVSATHPDGGLYFYDQDRRLFTDTDMHDPALKKEIELSYLYLQKILPAEESPGYDLVLDKHEEGKQMQWFYYYACHKTRYLFWLEEYDAQNMLSEVLWVGSPAHVKHRLEALFWSHWSLYPAVFEGRCLGPEICDELAGILSHGCIDVMTSKTSTLPYDDGTMKKMLELVEKAKESKSDLAYHTAAVTRLLSFFAHWRFLYFHGEKNARLDKHQTVYKNKGKRKRSLLITLLSPVLFLAPEGHIEEIEKLWTDQIIIDAAWKGFVPKLLEEWQELILLSTVMLSANVGFLAIPGVVILTSPSPIVSFTSPAQIASYMSMEASVGSIVIGLLLIRHNRSKQKEDAAGASKYLELYTHRNLGLEPMAIIFSLPWALLMWAMMMFFIALLFVCFRISTLSTRIFIAVTSVMVAVPIWWCVLWSWRSGNSGRAWIEGLDVPRVIGNPFRCLTSRRAHRPSPA